MAKKRWVIASDEGAEFARRQEPAADVGAEHELELSHHEEKAMVAAGWVEEPDPKQKKKEG